MGATKKRAAKARKQTVRRRVTSASAAISSPKSKNAREAEKNHIQAWVVTADMGLGHQRAAYPLRHVAHEGIMTLGKSANTPPEEQKLWERMRKSYEFLSRTKGWPS